MDNLNDELLHPFADMFGIPENSIMPTNCFTTFVTLVNRPHIIYISRNFGNNGREKHK